MPYVPLDLKGGFWRNGTPYQGRARWVNGDRVRWHSGLIRPIGGWERFTIDTGELDSVLPTPASQISRALHAWRRNDGSSVFVAGHNGGLSAWDYTTQPADITPAGFVPQPSDYVDQTGYGQGNYGAGSYGTPRDPAGGADVPPVFNWVFRNWGENLLAAPRGRPVAKLYEWSLSFASPAALVANAPVDFDAMHVTEQRIAMVAGSTLEPRRISWSDSEDNNLWTPALDNQAGFQTLPGVGRFKEILEFRDQVLLLSETDLHIARYLGPPYIYGFDLAGVNCGCIAGSAVVATQDFVMWPGERGFYRYDGTVTDVPCDVIDAIGGALRNPTAQKMVGFNLPDWDEIWWLFQGPDDDMVQSYVAYDYREGHWTTGTMQRSVGGVIPSLGGPLMIDYDGYVWNHEIEGQLPSDTDASEQWILSGPIEIGEGDMAAYLSALQPDIITDGEVDVVVIGRQRPTQADISFGPYTITYPAGSGQPVPMRAFGHTIQIGVIGKSGTFSLGRMRADLLGGGRR